MLNAKIKIKGSGMFITQISEEQTLKDIGIRMASGGFLLAEDNKWGQARKIVINAKDISFIVIEEKENV